MLILPPADQTVRIFSLDPGTDSLGLAVSDANLSTQKMSVIHVETLKASKHVSLYDEYELMTYTYGDRQARLQSHYDRLSSQLMWWTPHIVISESPFMGMRAHAFAALVECVDMIRWAVAHYNPTMPLELIAPMSAKKAVGASGRGKDKADVKTCVGSLMASGHIDLRSQLPFDAIDEHGIDAIAVGYAMAQSLQ